MTLTIRMTRRAVVTSMVFGAVSFVCLILYFLALTDIWHESGSPNFWHGQGLCSFEWRFLGVCFWPMLLFHLAFFVVMFLLLRSRASESGTATNGACTTRFVTSGATAGLHQ